MGQPPVGLSDLQLAQVEGSDRGLVHHRVNFFLGGERNDLHMHRVWNHHALPSRLGSFDHGRDRIKKGDVLQEMRKTSSG